MYCLICLSFSLDTRTNGSIHQSEITTPAIRGRIVSLRQCYTHQLFSIYTSDFKEPLPAFREKSSSGRSSQSQDTLSFQWFKFLLAFYHVRARLSLFNTLVDSGPDEIHRRLMTLVFDNFR